MRKFAAAGLLALGIVFANATPAAAQGAVVAEQFEAKAVVESIDHTTRTVLLRGEDGRLMSVKAGPEVRNLAQVKAGDRIVLRVRLGVVAEMAPPDGAGGPAAQTDMAARAPVGSKPGAVAGEAVRVRVTFNSYDRGTGTVAFTLPSGQPRRTVLMTQPMKDFAAGLTAGDKVDVTFARSVAVAVLPVP